FSRRSLRTFPTFYIAVYMLVFDNFNSKGTFTCFLFMYIKRCQWIFPLIPYIVELKKASGKNIYRKPSSILLISHQFLYIMRIMDVFLLTPQLLHEPHLTLIRHQCFSMFLQ